MKVHDILKQTENGDMSNSLTYLKKAKRAIIAALAGKVLYRGVYVRSFAAEIGKLPGGYTLYYVNARNEKRDSLTGTNFFMDLVDESPEWKDVPSRSKSVFTAAHASTVSEFGPVQIILPLDAVKTFAQIPQDFNIIRFPIGTDQKISTGTFMTDVSSITQKAITMYQCIQYILQTPTLEKLKSSENHSLWTEIKVAVRDLKTQAEFDKIKGELSNTAMYKALKDNGADLILNAKQHIINEKKVDAVGNVIRATMKTDSSASPLLKKFLENLDYEVSLIYRSERLLEYLGDFSGSLTDFLKREITPEKMSVRVHNSIESALEDSNDLTEVWFDGPYFMVSRGPSTRSDGSKRGVQDYFKQDDVREFFKSV